MIKAKEAPMGSDLALLTRQSGEQWLRFEHKGFQWEFEYEEVTWPQQWSVIESSWEAVKGQEDSDFNIKAYYCLALLKALKPLPGLTREFLEDLDTQVFAKLISIVPSPNLNLEVEKVKKERVLKPDMLE